MIKSGTLGTQMHKIQEEGYESEGSDPGKGKK